MNRLNDKPIGAHVGYLDRTELHDIALHMHRLPLELKEKVLTWLEYAAEFHTDFTVLATYPDQKEARK